MRPKTLDELQRENLESERITGDDLNIWVGGECDVELDLLVAAPAPAAQMFHCSCGAALTLDEYREHRRQGHDAPAAQPASEPPPSIWLSRHYPCLYRLEQSSTEDIEYIRAAPPDESLDDEDDEELTVKVVRDWADSFRPFHCVPENAAVFERDRERAHRMVRFLLYRLENRNG